MRDPFSYPEIDESLKIWLEKQESRRQVQYSTDDQLRYLVDLANKFGLHDAADIVHKLLEKLK